MRTVTREASAPSAAVSLPARSRPVELAGTLLQRLPCADGALAWVHEGLGLIGWGEAARLEVTGQDRFVRAREWFRELVARYDIDDSVHAYGSGMVAFGSFGFDDDSPSLLVVPQCVFGRRDGQAWLTTVGDPARPAESQSVRRPETVRYVSDEGSTRAFHAAVSAAVARIAAGQLQKIVLAQDLLAVADTDIDVRFVLERLAAGNRGCWTYAVDGLVGATPELLVAQRDDRVTSRVVAGTTARGGATRDDDPVGDLMRSAKDREEHHYALESVVDALTSYVHDLVVSRAMYPLELSTVTHLATDLVGCVTSGTHVLDVVAALHPTAAVGGTPTKVALDVLNELEDMDRGRYAGPVGWMDDRGNGEWGIALRCAQLRGPTARLFAGSGIVAGSDPHAEMLETQAKFAAVRDALDGRPS